MSRLVCPVCKREMLSADERCSGSFLDRNHPSNVAPVRPEHAREWGQWQDDVAGVVRECACGAIDFRPEG